MFVLVRYGAWLAPALAALLFIAGCGQTSGAALTTDEELARQSLVTALDAWKSGKTPADLKNASPPVIVGDHDWKSGAKLVGYELPGEEFNDGANLHITADLDLENADAGKSRQRIVYIVGTDPAITIFRAE
jgi:hypothetical protein